MEYSTRLVVKYGGYEGCEGVLSPLSLSPAPDSATVYTQASEEEVETTILDFNLHLWWHIDWADEDVHQILEGTWGRGLFQWKASSELQEEVMAYEWKKELQLN